MNMLPAAQAQVLIAVMVEQKAMGWPMSSDPDMLGRQKLLTEPEPEPDETSGELLEQIEQNRKREQRETLKEIEEG
jgi:hypothetical protein